MEKVSVMDDQNTVKIESVLTKKPDNCLKPNSAVCTVNSEDEPESFGKLCSECLWVRKNK